MLVGKQTQECDTVDRKKRTLIAVVSIVVLTAEVEVSKYR